MPEAAARLIRRTLPTSQRQCKLGLVLDGTLRNADDRTLPQDDIDWLADQLEHLNPVYVTRILREARFDLSDGPVRAHMAGTCGCEPGTVLRGC